MWLQCDSADEWHLEAEKPGIFISMSTTQDSTTAIAPGYNLHVCMSARQIHHGKSTMKLM